ncbi:hypothetical protein ABRQ07_17465 [Pectobacterium polonicum]|uniref:Uncharacterized protein n=1 Tax=Pectobacterium polonicum TaxID=2485124 RepID=A0ABV1PE91_9GAMM|nr:hypothetical protein [Pectobacterium polonicum]MDC9822086.1 hypothetical protein [Pectobacterium polonicum]
MSEINQICNDLGLPVGDGFTQDWAYELPDEYRTKEWLDKYITAYLKNGYSVEGKNELMTLSLDVTNDLLSNGVNVIDITIVKVLNTLSDNYNQHVDLVDYWSLDDEPLDDCFALTPEIRRLKKLN